MKNFVLIFLTLRSAFYSYLLFSFGFSFMSPKTKKNSFHIFSRYAFFAFAQNKKENFGENQRRVFFVCEKTDGISKKNIFSPLKKYFILICFVSGILGAFFIEKK